MKHLQFLRIYLQVLFTNYEPMAGKKPIPILLKSTSPEGEVRFFGTIKEASEGLGFSEHGLGKAYHTGRNRIGDYKLYTLDMSLRKFAVSL